MTNFIKIIFATIIFFICASCNKAPYENQPSFSCDLNFIQHENQIKYQAVLDQFSQSGIVGLSVIIDKADDEMWMGSSGYASVEEDIRMNNCNLYQTASLVKSIVGISTLQIIDEGLLQFDSKIEQYLSSEIIELIPNSENLTIEHLLNHTSGLPDIFDLEFISDFMNRPDDSYTRVELLSYVSGIEPLSNPGEAHFYSDTNYILLSLIIDKLKGDFIDYMNTNIFLPLGLDDTFYHNDSYPEIEGLPQSYWEQYNDGNIENISKLQKRVTNFIKGSDGVIASPMDMVAFYKNVFQGSLISEIHKEAIVNDQVAEPLEGKMNTGYAYGFMSIDDDGQTWIGHAGSQLGSSCFVFYNIETQDCIGVFTNTGTFLFEEKQSLIFGELWGALKAII